MLAALVFLAGLGAGALEIDEDFTSTAYSQSSDALTLEGDASLGGTLTGYFRAAPLDWREVTEIGFRVTARDGGPPVGFSLELLGGEDFSSIINIYEGSTAVPSAGPDVLWLELAQPGTGALGDVRGILFRWGGSGEPVDITFDAIVASVPANPMVTSTGYAEGKFSLSWEGTADLPVEVQRRASLTVGAWEVIASGITTRQFTDVSSPPGHAFYRVALP